MNSVPKYTVLISAGGTGGHVFPALAVAERLRAASIDVIWLGTERGMERKIVQAANIPFFVISAKPLNGQTWKKWLMAPAMLLTSVFQAVRLYRQQKPTMVLGMGGYVSGPAGMAAVLLRIPLVIHEQNAVPGMANRYLAPLATKVLEAFNGTFAKKYRAVATGNPIRQDILTANCAIGSQKSLRILVLGGSQGAHFLNKVVPAALALLPSHILLEVTHQTGEQDLSHAVANYEKLSQHAIKVVPFIEQMGHAYANADIVIARAGALTVSELASVGKAAILIPYPHATNDHQRLNAQWLAKKGAAVVLNETEVTPEKLMNLIQTFASDRHQIQAMAEAAKQQHSSWQSDVVQECLEVCYA